MKKNGFTLIELLAIIVLLGTILTITLPPLKKFINNTCLKAYEINLDSMKDAASGYVLKANIEVPSGIQTRIELSDLIARKLMNRIVDPKSKEECDGYVTVTMLNDAYHFTSYLDCGSNYKSPDYGKTDYVLPVITLLGDNPVTINAGETYIEPGFTANDDVDGDITNKVKSTGYINPNLPGTYEITYSVTDNANNFFEIKRRVIVIDNASPIIIFGTNGNSTYAKSYSTTVTVTDNVSVNTSSLKYQWTTSATAPTEASFSTSFTNGGTITSQAGVTGSYYLWILAKDTSGNTTIQRSNLFNLDNIKPIITMNGSSSITIEKGSTYSDAGATATDEHSGISGSVTSAGSVNPNIVGTYTVTYNVSDKAGNAADPVIRTVNVEEPVIAGYDPSKGVNAPRLATGMIPIKWNGSAWVNTTKDDVDWYNYTTTDKKWANARTADGSMWVWIPRYIYKISSGWHTSATGVIDVQFSKETDDTRGGTVTITNTGKASDSNGKWTNHPAFTFGTTQLTGIWVAKFEPTAAEGVANGYTSDDSCPLLEDNVTTKTIKILPNVQSWRCITIGNAFTAIRNMETNPIYGWAVASGLQANGSFTTDTNNIDTHLMKNVEWGAIAYLSKSNYGQGTNEIWINNSQQYITGCAGNTATEGFYNGCQNTYESIGGVKASATGNVYGIYDLSGGAWEGVAAYVDNNAANLGSEGPPIVNANSKYKDIYTKGNKTDDQPSNYALTVNKKGDAVYETSNASTGRTSWFSDFSSMPAYGVAWFRRGSYILYNPVSDAGIFSFDYTWSGAVSSNSFRPVLVVGAGL